MLTTLEKTLAAEIAQLHETHTYKKANELQAPQAPRTRMDGRPVINLSSNNYLALANHPRVVEAAKRAVDRFGLGTASVRFICGTMTCHLELERKIAHFIGCEASTTFISCWDANVGVMPTLCPTPEDAIFSDALNHASIIDAIRLSKAQRFIYRHRNLKELETMLNSPEAKKSRNRLIITDGVFSMEGDIAELPTLKELASRHDALLVIDESHATGVLGATGRGTAEHFGVLGEGTLQISTLGKALGGACGGYVAGSQVVCDYLVQKARPQLFSNALPPAVCYGSMAAIDVLMGTATGSPSTGSIGVPPVSGSIGVPPVSGSIGVPPVSGSIGVPPVESDSGPALLARLRDNVAHFRAGMKELGLKTLEGVTPIVPVMVGETATAIAMQKALLEQGVFVSGFGYPVVPKGEARLRCQVSAGHTRDDLNQCLAAFRTVAEKFPESCGKHC